MCTEFLMKNEEITILSKKWVSWMICFHWNKHIGKYYMLLSSNYKATKWILCFVESLEGTFLHKIFFFIRIKVINFGLVFCSEWHSDTLILETHYRQKWHEGGGLNVSHCKEKIINTISDLPLGLLEGVGIKEEYTKE